MIQCCHLVEVVESLQWEARVDWLVTFSLERRGRSGNRGL